MKTKKPESLQVPFDLLFDNMLEGLIYCRVVFDSERNPVDFVFLRVNKNFVKLTGLKNVESKKATELIPEIKTSNPELFEVYERVSSTGTPERLETYIEPLARWFLVSVYPFEADFFMAVFQNITDQKETERNLENAKIAARNVLEDLSIEKSKAEIAKAKDEAILESIGEGLIAVDNDKRIIVINKVAGEMLGWKIEDLIGTMITDLPLEDENGYLVPLDKRPTTIALRTGEITKVTHFCVRKDKTRFIMAITTTPIKLDGKIIGLIEIIRDITHEKEIDKAKSEFVSLASHQLRTPLTTISWYTEMILNGDVGTVVPSQKKYLEEIYHGNQRMIDLVNTLLNVSRIELGTFTAESKETDIIKLAESVLSEQKPKIDEKELIVKESFAKDVPTLLTDPKLIRMIFQNLLSNSIEYTPPGGKVEFSISLEPDSHKKVDTKKTIIVRVSDTGYGIPRKEQGKIFTKLFRADNVRDKGINGTGLGLYIVKSTVQNLGGEIWFESEENVGSTFYATLPFNISI